MNLEPYRRMSKTCRNEKAMRWVCDVYIVDDYYSDDQRGAIGKEPRAMVKTNVGEEMLKIDRELQISAVIVFVSLPLE